MWLAILSTIWGKLPLGSLPTQRLELCTDIWSIQFGFMAQAEQESFLCNSSPNLQRPVLSFTERSPLNQHLALLDICPRPMTLDPWILVLPVTLEGQPQELWTQRLKNRVLGEKSLAALWVEPRPAPAPPPTNGDAPPGGGAHLCVAHPGWCRPPSALARGFSTRSSDPTNLQLLCG